MTKIAEDRIAKISFGMLWTMGSGLVVFVIFLVSLSVKSAAVTLTVDDHEARLRVVEKNLQQMNKMSEDIKWLREQKENEEK